MNDTPSSSRTPRSGVDAAGRTLPPIEMPDAARLRVYGDFLFLAFRSPRHRAMTLNALRLAFEPPILTGQYNIFRFDDVPRGLLIWAKLGPEAERRYLEEGYLLPEDWNSGNRLWIVDIIAPYRGLMPSIARWVMKPGNFTDEPFRYRRVVGDRVTRKIVLIDKTKPGREKARFFDVEDYLAEFAGEG